ncbi:MAG TPA: Imm47 family immunity protein [Gemmataceae bacterium]|nr:Imm47 family immunity protein [Gemmataceae bacterium]
MSALFGQSPYRACFYGAMGQYASKECGALSVLCNILESLKAGDFSKTAELRSYLTHTDYDLRQYSHQLFAHACSHQQVEWFASAFDTIANPEELHRIIFRLGETLSGSAIPLLRCLTEQYGDDPEVCAQVLLSMRLMGGYDDIECCQDDILNVLSEAESRCTPPHYYYRGNIVFAGDITKELVTNSVIANRERRKVVLFRQPQILSVFSGTDCPIQHGQMVADNNLSDVFSYVAAIARMTWQPGVKYFYRHDISS